MNDDWMITVFFLTAAAIALVMLLRLFTELL